MESIVCRNCLSFTTLQGVSVTVSLTGMTGKLGRVTPLGGEKGPLHDIFR